LAKNINNFIKASAIAAIPCFFDGCSRKYKAGLQLKRPVCLVNKTMPHMNVAVFSTKSYDKEYLDRLNKPVHHQLVYFDAPLNTDTAGLTKGFDAVCAFVNDKIDAETIKKMASNGIRLIALRCAGFNNVDLESAESHQIKVVRVPAYSPHAVAEHTASLILTLNRKTHKAYNRVRENNFSLERLLGFNLFGKTVGVIGTGKIGSVFSKIMLGFGCRVLAFDPYPNHELVGQGVTYQSFNEVIRAADIISLHCPLNQETYHLIDKKTLATMKEGVMLINTSRGAVIHTQDVIDSLKKGHLGYLGIDVYEQEENIFFKDLSESIVTDDLIARLISFPNVLVTSHQGFFTREALEQIALTTLQNLTNFELGIHSPNEVKKERRMFSA
jgi:D-lactate dehydrogenase